MALAPNSQPASLETDLIPPAARAAAARADALQAELIASGQIAPPAAQPGMPMPPPPEGWVREQPPVQPQAPPPVAPPVNAPLIPPQAPPPQDGQLSVEEILAMQAQPGSELAKLQHAFKSHLGRFRAAREKDGQTIEQLAAELRQRTEQAPPRNFDLPPQTPEQELLEAGATEEEVANFGEDMTAMMQRIAKGAAKAEAERLRAQIAPTIQQLGNLTVQERQEKMVGMLDQNLVPWQVTFGQLNTHEPFLAWLQLTDTMSGATRQSLLETAWNSQNGSRVWAICSSFLNEVAPRAPAQPTPQDPPGTLPQVTLESLAAPGRGPRSVQPVTPQDGSKPHYTKQDVRAFYVAKAKGFYKPEEAAAWEAEIFAAGRENRIH